MDDNTNLEDKTKPDNAVTIQITQKRNYSKGKSVPKHSPPYILCNARYSFSNGSSTESEGACHNPLECLTNLLVNVELNRDGRQIGPIHATFKLIGNARSYELSLQKILEMYARSENTTITFENKE